MRIALINPVLGEGGAGRAMVNMANHWADQRHEVTLFTFEGPDTPPNYRLADAVQLQHLDLERESANAFTSLRNNLWRFRRIRREVLATAPDVVVSFIDSGNVRVLLALLLARVPVIVSERVHPAFEPLAWHWRVLRRLTYPLASAVVVQTEAIARYVGSWGLRRVRTIANPVPS